MSEIDEIDEPHITTIEVDGRRYNVSCRIVFDGIEYVGHLWFADEAWDDDAGIRDHGAMPGRRRDDVLGLARALSELDLVQRYRRAVTDKRRYHGLRKATEQIIDRIRYLNRVATSMRAGLLDVEEAAAELDATEKQLHDLVDRLRSVAGVES